MQIASFAALTAATPSALSTAFSDLWPAIGYMLMLLDVSILIAVHEMGHWLVAHSLGFRTPVFSVGFGKRQWSWVVGNIFDTEVRLSPILAGGYVSIPEMEEDSDLDGEARKHFAVWKRIAVALAGVAFNFIFAVMLLAAYFIFVGEPSTTVKSTKISGLSTHNSVARDAGLQINDRFNAIGEQPVVSFQDIARELCRNPGKSVLVTVERGNEKFLTTLLPDSECRIGVSVQQEIEPKVTSVGPGRAVFDASAVTASTLKDVAVSIGMLTHVIERPAEISPAQLELRGFVGVIEMGSDAMNDGIFSLIMFNVMISCSLIFLNLLPLPILDGGQVVYLLAEKVRGKPISFELKQKLAYLFGGLFVIVMAYGLSNDLYNIFWR
jgi:regulator of sigma E protease